LHCPASQQSLEQDHGSSLFVMSLEIFSVLPFLAEVIVNGCVGPHLDVVDGVPFFLILLFLLLLLDLHVNRGLGFFQLSYVNYVAPRKSLLEFLVNFGDRNLGREDLAR